MIRETQRQIARLRALKNYIQNNPKEFRQSTPEDCVIGLGVRFYRGIMRTQYQARTSLQWMGWNKLQRDFAKRYGVTEETASKLFSGNYSGINGNFKKDYKSCGLGAKPIPVRSVVRILEYLVKQKEKGNTP